MVIAGFVSPLTARAPFVAALAGAVAMQATLAHAQERRFQFERLDPPTRVKVLAALTALIILMIGLMFLASLGARWVRRYGHRTPLSFERRTKPVLDPDDWAGKPLAGDADDQHE